MATKNPLDAVLARLESIDKKLSALPKIQKDIAGIKKDIELIKECVPFENAAKFPSKVRAASKAKGGGGKGGFAMAAAGK